jgi:hypothetical protein
MEVGPMPVVPCPGCDRTIPVTAAEVRGSLVLECAACRTCFSSRKAWDDAETARRRRAAVPLFVLAGLILLGCALALSWALRYGARKAEEWNQRRLR